MGMRRTIVQVISVRMRDLLPGDIINKNGDQARGWFRVKDLQPLPKGVIAVIAEDEQDSINSAGDDLVGLQVHKVVEVPDSPSKATQEPSAA